MIRLGLPSKLIRMIMFYVSSITFLVLINGEPHGDITPSRGIQQGDPLSPFFFLLCTKGLTSLLTLVEKERRINGVKICRGAPPISHILFAYDIMLFCKAIVEKNSRLQQLLHTYSKASGQAINLDKT